MLRETRSGRTYSPYLPILVREDFDMEPLLGAAVKRHLAGDGRGGRDVTLDAADADDQGAR